MSPKKNLNTFFKIIIAPVIVFFSIDAYGRIPANLAGTDIFPETITYHMPTSKQSSKGSRAGLTSPKPRSAGGGGSNYSDDEMPAPSGQKGTAESEQVEVVLPTKVLNLSYGAEFFTVAAQSLWNFGELVRMGEKPAVAPQAAEEGVAGGAAEGIPAVGQQAVAAGAAEGKIKELHNFYKDIVTKELLPLAECNPLAILMRALFIQIPGTSSLGDFRVSVLCCVNDKDATPQENLQKTLTQWADIVAATLSIYESMAQEKDLKKLVALIDGTFKKTVTKNNKLVDRLTKNIFNFAGKVKQPKLSVLLLSCIRWSETNGFGKDFPLRILIGGVYALAGDNQENIFHFYRALKVALERAMPAITTQIAGLPIPTAGEDFPAPFTKTDCLPSAAITTQTSMPQHAFSLLLLQLGSFQPLAYTNTKPRPDIKSFPDCFETTLRNIVLFLLINDDGGFKKDLVAQDYKAFFTQHRSMQAQTSQTARDEWAALVSNIPGALYLQKRLDGLEALEYKYELRSSLIQLLFFLNKIFELGVDFEGHPLSIQVAQADANKAFIATKLPLVVAALKEKLEMTEDPLTDVVQKRTTGADITDVPGHYITLKILNGVGSISASINVYAHAEIIPDKESAPLELTPLSLELFPYLSTALKFDAFNRAEMSPVYALPFLNKPLNNRSIEQIVPIFTSSQAMLRILYAAITRDYEIDKNVWLRNLKELVRNGQGFEQAIAAAVEGIKSSDGRVRSSALNLFKALFEKGQVFEEAITAAVEGINSDSIYVRSSALELFKALFEKDKGFEAAIAAASDCMKSRDNSVRSSALKLFDALVEKGRVFEQAITTAVEGIKSRDAYVRSSALNLFRALFEKGRGFAEAITAAVEGINSSDGFVQSSALDLFDRLFEENKGFEQAIALAEEGIKSSNDSVRWSALDLFSKLVRKSQGFEAAITAAVEGINSDRTYVRSCALDLFKALFEKDKGFEAAIAAAVEGIKSSDHSVQSSALDLFSKLVRKSQGFDAAITAAVEGINSDSIYVRSSALELFKGLFEKDKGFEAAIAAAVEGIKSSDHSVQSSALDLFSKLVRKSQGFDAAITAAVEGINSDSIYVRSSALELFKGLFEKDKGFEAAIAAAAEGIKSSDNDVRFSALNLFKALFKNGQGFDEAQSILAAGEINATTATDLREALVAAKSKP